MPAEEGPTDGIDAERTQTNGAATAMDVDENVDIVSAKNRAEVKNEEEGEGEEIDPRTLRRHYRLHPKGVGVVCIRKEGLQPGMFVNHYLGEMYSPWRWYERCDAMKKRNPNQELPSFFNITLERPKDDVRGKDTVFVEAMHECEFASRMSHSCAGELSNHGNFARGEAFNRSLYQLQDRIRRRVVLGLFVCDGKRKNFERLFVCVRVLTAVARFFLTRGAHVYRGDEREAQLLASKRYALSRRARNR